MIPSFHDYYAISYAVACESRVIEIRMRHSSPAQSREIWVVTFRRVQGYGLKNDAFGNIIEQLVEVPLAQLLEDCRLELEESYNLAGAPGPWAADLSLARRVLESDGQRGFVLTSSYGLSGWIVAGEMEVELAAGH